MFTPLKMMWIVIIYLMAMLTYDYVSATVSQEEVTGAIKSAEGAMYYAVNKGDYRVNNHLSMNEKRFLESYQLLTKQNSRSQFSAYRYNIHDIDERKAVVSGEALSDAMVMNYMKDHDQDTIKRGNTIIYIWDDLHPVK